MKSTPPPAQPAQLLRGTNYRSGGLGCHVARLIARRRVHDGRTRSRPGIRGGSCRCHIGGGGRHRSNAAAQAQKSKRKQWGIAHGATPCILEPTLELGKLVVGTLAGNAPHACSYQSNQPPGWVIVSIIVVDVWSNSLGIYSDPSTGTSQARSDGASVQRP